MKALYKTPPDAQHRVQTSWNQSPTTIVSCSWGCQPGTWTKGQHTLHRTYKCSCLSPLGNSTLVPLCLGKNLLYYCDYMQCDIACQDGYTSFTARPNQHCLSFQKGGNAAHISDLANSDNSARYLRFPDKVRLHVKMICGWHSLRVLPKSQYLFWMTEMFCWWASSTTTIKSLSWETPGWKKGNN